MNLIINNSSRFLLFTGMALLLFWGCSRSVDSLEEAENTNNPEVFIDTFSEGLEYAAFEGSVPEAFEVVDDVTYNNSEQSMRFEVPDFGDERGSYAGGAFFTNNPRDLSEYNALTFYARASESTQIGVLGLGIDLDQNLNDASITDLNVGTSWQKYIIPVPDPEKLDNEKGLFYYSSGPIDESGYTFWIDDLQYESLSTIVFVSASIFEGEDREEVVENGETIEIDGLFSTHNLPDGSDINVGLSPNYFDFSSSDESVAEVNDEGVVTILSEGEAEITASFRGEDAQGSLLVTSEGDPTQPENLPEEPSQNPEDVISLYTNVYDNVTVDTWNTGWEFSTARETFIEIQGQDVIRYQDLNFVGIEFAEETINASEMTHFRIDIWTPEATDAGQEFKVLLVDFGADGEFNGGDDSQHELTFTSPTLQTENWVTLEIPMSDFTGLNSRENLAQMVLSGDLPTVFVTNVYFYNDGGDGGNGGGDSQAINLPVTFEDGSIDYALTDFGGNDSEIVVDPTDGSNMVAQSTKTSGAETWAGTTIGGTVGFENPIPFTESETTMSVRVWSPASDIPVRLKVEDAGNDGISVETEATTTVANEWETLVFDFSNQAEGTAELNVSNIYDKASIFFDFGTVGSDEIYYWDDVEFGGESDGGGNDSGGSDVTLSDLQVDGTTVSGFAPDNFSYNVELSEGTTTVPTVTATTNDPNATVDIVDATEIPGTTEVTVSSSEDQSNNVYTVSFSIEGDESAPKNPIDFEAGGYGADWDWNVFENDTNPAVEIIDNPDPSGANTSSTVLQFTALDSGQPWAGFESVEGQLGEFLIDETNCVVTMDVWKPVTSDVQVKFDTGAPPNDWGTGTVAAANTETNQWETLTFNFCELSPELQNPNPVDGFGGLKRMAIFPDFNQDGRGQDNVIYIDNIEFSAL